MPSPMREMSAWLTREQLNGLALQAKRLSRRVWLQTLLFLRWGSGRLSSFSTKSREEFAARSPAVTANVASLIESGKKASSAAYAWCLKKAEELPPTFQARTAGMANALSSGARAKDTKLSQMLIVAGALLLICGGLLFGSGLILRAGTLSSPATSGASEPIAWLFDTPEAPLTHRIVFTLSGSPANLRIDGLTIRGENTLDEPLTEVEAVIKPDKRQSDIDLALNPGRPAPQTAEPNVVEIEVTASVTPVAAIIPARAPFELVHAFPAQDGQTGLAVEEFFETYGGLTLNVRYGLEGKQRTVIQYLSPETLKAQLAEIQAAGS